MMICLLLSAVAAAGQPAQILLLRHAEKPDDPAAVQLSPRGEERARALVRLLGGNSALTSNAPIAALYATRVTRHFHSQRTGSTLAPLARQLGLPVQTPYDSEQYARLAREILGNHAYAGKSVVICWTHHDLADLAAALGVKPKPPPWRDWIYDRLWRIQPGPPRVEFQDQPQRLLAGDSTR